MTAMSEANKPALSDSSKYQAYPEYKHSGVEWVGDIPVDWLVTRLKYVASIFGRIGFRGYTVNDIVVEGEGAIVLSPSNVVGDKFTLATKSFLSWHKYYESPEIMVEKNDLLLVKTGSTYGKSTIVSDVDFPMTINPQMALIKNTTIDSRFLSYLFNSSLIKAKIDVNNTGSGMPTMTQENINNFPIPRPNNTLDIQIANFLDHETAKIDTLIDKQQQLIKLLKEKRQAVISHAVTKGLNAQAPMKYSGVEWLGEVPVHWVVKRNKHLMEFVTSGSRGWAEYYSDDGQLFFRIANLTRDTIEPKLESIQNVKPPMGAEGERSKIQSGDLLISITADLGSVCVADDSIAGGFVSQHVSLCRPNSLVISSRWLAYFVLSDAAKEQFIGSGYGGTKIQLSLEDIRELNIAYPPVHEQEEIALYIDTKLEKFELLMNRAESQVNLLQERRTALISAAVTGKIDVRHFTVKDGQAPANQEVRDKEACL
tara:strand:- start:33806 stop:35254 length:1449 start_codon:yes stop_codon:yes gene_type:complete